MRQQTKKKIENLKTNNETDDDEQKEDDTGDIKGGRIYTYCVQNMIAEKKKRKKMAAGKYIGKPIRQDEEGEGEV